MNIQVLEQEFARAKAHAMAMLEERLAIAKSENRPLSPGETAAIDAERHKAEAVRDQLAAARGREQILHDVNAALGLPAAADHAVRTTFANSPLVRWLQDTRTTRGGVWQSPVSEIARPQFFATLLDSSAGSGGALLTPDVRPIIVPSPLPPSTVRSLCAAGTTTSNTIQYMKEIAFTNAAAAVKEGDPKPESTLAFARVDSPVRKLAHWVPTTSEMLDDAPQLAAYVNTRLVAGLQAREDDELLNGSGVDPHLLGFLNLPGLAPALPRGATESNADVIAKQIAAVAATTNTMPTGIVLNPVNFLSVLLAKTTDGLYVSGQSPLDAPGPRAVWGLSVVVTAAIPVGVGLVGAFASASQIFDNGGIRVDASNSHQDFFVKNLVAIRAEERLALAVYQEGAFGQVTNLA